MGNNTLGDCNVASGADSKGLIDDTCTDTGADGSSIYGSSDSDAYFYKNKTSQNSFVGKIVDGDRINTTAGVETNSLVPHLNITDWLNFETPLRYWGVDGSDYPNANNRGVCNSDSCAIWDFSLLSTDSVLLNAPSIHKPVPSFPTFVSGEICPDIIHGDQSVTDRYRVGNPEIGDNDFFCDLGEECENSHTFLLHAREILFDEIGNDNGLCETGESCLYSPNAGVYQGHGTIDASKTCVFQDGLVTGVTMYSYEHNGY